MRGTIIIGLVLAAMPAEAQSYRQFSEWCFGQSTDAETLRGCDAVIRWARETKHDAAAAFYNRGIAYRNQGKFDRAIEDFDQALGLKPAFADAWNERGVAYRQRGDNPPPSRRRGAWPTRPRRDLVQSRGAGRPRPADRTCRSRSCAAAPTDAEALLARGRSRAAATWPAATPIVGGPADDLPTFRAARLSEATRPRLPRTFPGVFCPQQRLAAIVCRRGRLFSTDGSRRDWHLGRACRCP